MIAEPSDSRYLPIEDHGVIGDGRSAALVGTDGRIDWWCAPSIDSPPLFASLLDANKGGVISLKPTGSFETNQIYKENSNVLVTTFLTHSGSIRITDSLNSGNAGRLPWTELGRRIECIDGSVELALSVTFPESAQVASLHQAGQEVQLVDNRLFKIISDVPNIGFESLIHMKTGEKYTIGFIVTENQPLMVTPIEEIDQRIDHSHNDWHDWAKTIKYQGSHRKELVRSLLALKLLLYSPSGAIAAAVTSSLPEDIGGEKNFDYRYAWVRDSAYTIKAMLRGGLTEEVHAALAWLLNTVDQVGLEIFYSLRGEKGEDESLLPYEGYRSSGPTHRGNRANKQLQLGLYGDILETVHLYATSGNVLDPKTKVLLTRLTNDCVKRWHKRDAGIWELEDTRHYTISKIGCWMTFDRAVKLCDAGYLPTDHRERWVQERDKVEAYIEKYCWNKKMNSYVQAAGSKKIDASIMLATRFGYPHKERLAATLHAIERGLKRGAYVYRYSDVEREEGAFTACSYWLVEGYAFLGFKEEAVSMMNLTLKHTRNHLGLMSEMTDPSNDSQLGNTPQGLSHLAMIHAVDAVESMS